MVVKIANQPASELEGAVKNDGKIKHEEKRRSCPSNVPKARKPKRTSLGGGKIREGSLHGTSNSNPKKERSFRSQNKNHTKKLSRKEYDTPFDEKGRCHYHKNVQLAAKKMSGGWKVLHNACPKCMEENIDVGVIMKTKRSKSANGKGKHDRNGCCVIHSHIQVAKKKLLGGWKVMRTCPACSGDQDIGLNDDRISVCSKGSRKSIKSSSSRSVKSTKSAKTTKSTKSQGKNGQAASSSRYGTLPFDGDGYCCQHPSILLAQKKMIGGWKIIHDVCPECALDLGTKNTKKAPRRKSRSGRVSNTTESETSSHKSSAVETTGGRKKRIKVKNFKTEDENGKPGKYTGDVNEDYRPNGQGTMKYNDGSIYEGVWCEGSQVHGRTKKKQEKNENAPAV